MTGPARLGVALPLGSLTLLLAALWAELVWGLPPPARSVTGSGPGT